MASSALPPLTPTLLTSPEPPRLRRDASRAGSPLPPREIDWLRIGVWAGVLVVSCVVWGGLPVAIAALVG